MNWKKISKPWIPENKSDEIFGKLLRIRKDVGDNNSMMYDFETENSIVGVWGSVVLDAKMEMFEVGHHVKIVFLGKKEGGKKEAYKDYDVYKGVE